jgi:hypothetical protein
MENVVELPTLECKSLYEAIMFTNGEGFDICDIDWDWGTYLGIEKDWKGCADKETGKPDYYYAFMLFLAINIKCKEVRPKWYSPCYIGEFVKKNMNVLRDFFNKHNREGYRPMDYENADDDSKDDGFYEAYMLPLESMIEGNYCDSDYKELYYALGGVDQWQNQK